MNFTCLLLILQCRANVMDELEPVEPDPGACCGEGCASCVWDTYREQLSQWQRRQQQTPSQGIDEEVGLSKIHFIPCRLLSIISQTIDTSIYKFALPSGKFGIPLQPGQHLELKAVHLNQDIIRKYSPINWTANEFDVIIKRYKTGQMSAFLESVEEGAELDWRGPYGNIKYSSTQQKRLLILCAGTGVAPMIPVVRSIVEDPCDETTVRLLCGCRTLGSRLLLKELKELAGYWNFSFIHHITADDGSPGWGEEVIRERISETHVTKACMPDSRVFICGPDEFVKDMSLIVTGIGVPFYCF